MEFLSIQAMTPQYANFEKVLYHIRPVLIGA